MKIFNEINVEINSRLNNGDPRPFLGHYPRNEFDEEDVIELSTWASESSLQRSKIIGNQTFVFDLIISDDE